MAWHLASSMNTIDLANVVSRINKEDLQAGDILGVIGPGTGGDNGHVLIFDQWADAGHNNYYAYELASGNNTAYHVVKYPYGSANPGVYYPYRYRSIVNDPAPVVSVGPAINYLLKRLESFLPGHARFVRGPVGSPSKGKHLKAKI